MAVSMMTDKQREVAMDNAAAGRIDIYTIFLIGYIIERVQTNCELLIKY